MFITDNGEKVYQLKDISNLDLIKNIAATKLSQINGSSIKLELKELDNIDEISWEMGIRTECNEFSCDIQNYLLGNDAQKNEFIQIWLRVIDFARTVYSVPAMQKIKKLRIENKMSQKDVAEKLHISSQAYGHYENCKREPDITTLVRLSHIFNVSLDYLFDLRISHGCEIGVSKDILLQSEADFINRLKANGVHVYMFSNLTEEHIFTISSIIKQVAKIKWLP